MSKCIGCGAILQNKNENEKGYVVSTNSLLCKRCFDLKNYNKNTDFESNFDNDLLLKNINKKGLFTIFLCDIISLNDKVIDIYNNIKNAKIFVLTKVDIIPKNIKYEKLIKSLKNNYNIDTYLFSIKNKKLINSLLNIINEKKNVIISGITSSGKSTLINTLFNQNITASHYKNTTLDFIMIKHDDLIIFDSPGFDTKIITSKIKNTLKEKIINLKKGYEVNINGIRFYSENDINFVIFMPSVIKVSTKKITLNDGNKEVIKDNSDLVFDTFFIYFKKEANIFINNKNYLIRKSVVGKYE